MRKARSVAKPRRTFECPVEVPIAIVGGRWKTIILWYLLHEPRRNGELVRLMPRISQKVLTQQLRELEAEGLVARRVHDQVPPKVVYSMTPEGRKLEPVLQALCDWGIYWARTTGAEVTALAGR